MKFNGNPAKLRSTPPEFVIELPAQIRLVYASTRALPHKTIPFLEEFDGKVRRYRMTLPCGKIHIAPKGPVWSGGFYLYLQAEKGSAGQTAEIRHFFEHKGERVVPGSFRLSVLPELGKAKNHFRDFLFSVHEFSSAGHEDTSILKERLDFWTSFTTGKKIYQFVGWSSYRLPEKSRELLKKYCNFYFFTYACIHSTMILQDADCDDLGFFVRGKVTRLGVPLFQNHNGRVNPGAICPQYLMGDPEGLFYGEYLRRGVEKAQKHFSGLNTFIIDYEPEAEKGTCDDCRRDFARFAKLGKVPSRDEIRPGKPYHRKWREYKLHQNRVIMNNIADGVKKHFPDMKVSFCCTELRPAIGGGQHMGRRGRHGAGRQDGLLLPDDLQLRSHLLQPFEVRRGQSETRQSLSVD